MKVLYIAKFDLPDFQSDMIFHGLRSLLGEDCVDHNEAWLMYKNQKETHWNTRVPNNGKSYGRGFTLYGMLPEMQIDRTDIENKIRNKYFDKIIYGSIQRCADYIQTVIENYSPEDIIFIDGEDSINVHQQLLGRGLYFKRELVYHAADNLFSLNFCIPKELIVTEVPEKTQDWGTIIPGDMSTYIFDTPEEYYADYAKSLFGLTTKKGGWDCLRHYEILMNGAIPYFPDLLDCPKHTMVRLPKELILKNNEMIASGVIVLEQYHETVNKLLQHTRQHLTTEAVAKYVIRDYQ